MPCFVTHMFCAIPELMQRDPWEPRDDFQELRVEGENQL